MCRHAPVEVGAQCAGVSPPTIVKVQILFPRLGVGLRAHLFAKF